MRSQCACRNFGGRVERKVSDGSFQLLFGNAISKEILFNSTASDMKNALRDSR
jgi:hypothetical protein